MRRRYRASVAALRRAVNAEAVPMARGASASHLARMEPHANQPVVYAGAPLDDADAVLIMVHGRNAAPRNILELIDRFRRPRVACAAPAAAGGTWYPNSFMAPRASNEPGLSSALAMLEALVTATIDRGVPANKIVLLGFSQGACLTSEFVLRHPRRYGGVAIFSGGLIGVPGTTWDDVPVDGHASLADTPMFFGCSDVDGHIPKERVLESEAVFRRLGARVTRTLYPGMGHLVNDDEIQALQQILDEASAN
jgi:phospholipase/carboxylesterase